MKVRTNNVPRDIIQGYDLTKKEREEFDYLDWTDECGVCGDGFYHSFFRFKGQVYDLHEACHYPEKGWDAMYNDTAFSATVIRLVNANTQVVVGQIFS